MINLELFCCAGGMAEGFRRAGIRFDVAVDFEPNHCDSYERNLGHRPVQMNVMDLLRLARLGLLPWSVDLLVADPPCTPWSRAGKRKGTKDERDMMEPTCELITLLKPRRYLIGNVPGLDDDKNLPIVQQLIGGLSKHGYCVADFAKLDAADYGVPQNRIRPFWFGHREGPCIMWPQRTHCAPDEIETTLPLPLPGVSPLLPHVTCRQALRHLPPKELGRPVRMRKRNQNGHQHGSVPDRPARVVGTSNLSDGNVITAEEKPRRSSKPDKAADGTLVLNHRHRPSDSGSPAKTISAKVRGNGGQAMSVVSEPTSKHPAATADEPAPTIRAGGGGHSGPHVMLARESGRKSARTPQSERVMTVDKPSLTVQAREDRKGRGSPVLEWPWDRPATSVLRDDRIPPPGHHNTYSILSQPNAVLLSERAAAILQGFPDPGQEGGWVFKGRTKKQRWSQIGQAMPPALAAAVARAIVDQNDRALTVAKRGGLADVWHESDGLGVGEP